MGELYVGIGKVIDIYVSDDSSILSGCSEAYLGNTLIFSKVKIESLLSDFEYVVNEDGTYTLTGWKETLKGEPSTRLVIPNDNRIKL